MKYIVIPLIALGFVLSSIFGIEYHCEGEEMFPTYYGSPFVFREKSLGSSMEYFYSLSGLILNVIVWSIPITILRFGLLQFLEICRNKVITRLIYNGIVGLLLIFSTLSIGFSYITLGRGFEKGLNYWYMDLDKEANDWGMKCEGVWVCKI